MRREVPAVCAALYVTVDTLMRRLGASDADRLDCSAPSGLNDLNKETHRLFSVMQEVADIFLTWKPAISCSLRSSRRYDIASYGFCENMVSSL